MRVLEIAAKVTLILAVIVMAAATAAIIARVAFEAWA